MKAVIDKSEINGKVKAPSSKSYTIRALMCAALAPGESEIIKPLSSDDTIAASYALENIGVRVIQRADYWRVLGGRLIAPKSDLECRESAATLRFLLAISAIIPAKIRLKAKPSLVSRPIAPLLDALHQIGIESHRESDGDAILVHGGNIKSGMISLPGDVSSQFVSALLILAPLVKGGLSIKLTTPLESRAYVEMTIECLAHFGIKVVPLPSFSSLFVGQQKYRPAKYTIEGDWSSVSYLLAAAAIIGDVEITNLSGDSLQSDKILLNYLHEMGVPVYVTNTSFRTKKTDSRLKPINADLNECIDLLPTLAVLAAFADGTSEFRGIARARLKESDRVTCIREELSKAGVKVIDKPDSMIVYGSKPTGGNFNSHNDHRIAMAMSLIGLACGNTTIDGAECVAKTYPDYWNILESLGGKVNIHDK